MKMTFKSSVITFKIIKLKALQLLISFNLVEVDLWWILSFKKRHFQFAKTYFYCMEEELEPEIKIMLQTYNVEIIDSRKSKSDTEGLINQSGNYKEFYELAIEEITRIINSRKRN